MGCLTSQPATLVVSVQGESRVCPRLPGCTVAQRLPTVPEARDPDVPESILPPVRQTGGHTTPGEEEALWCTGSRSP